MNVLDVSGSIEGNVDGGSLPCNSYARGCVLRAFGVHPNTRARVRTTFSRRRRVFTGSAGF